MFGDTYRTEDDCFRLTDEEDYSSGSIWYRRPISLNAPFSIELSILVGCKDADGADGIEVVPGATALLTGSLVVDGCGGAGALTSDGTNVVAYGSCARTDGDARSEPPQQQATA